jgi:hypothetical protein
VIATSPTKATPATANNDPSGELTMLLLNESLALERMSRRHRAVTDERVRQVAVARRLAAARRLQRRADAASRRARSLMLSV